MSEQKMTKKTLVAGIFLLRADHGFIYTESGRVQILSIKICSDVKYENIKNDQRARRILAKMRLS